MLRKHPHGLTVISRYKDPPGKAWKIVGKASELGEEVYIMEGAYYMPSGWHGTDCEQTDGVGTLTAFVYRRTTAGTGSG